MLLIFLAAIAAGITYDALTMPRYSGPVSERFDGKTFKSPSYEKKKPIDLVKWRWNRTPGAWESRAVKTPDQIIEREHTSLRVTLVNHSTVLIQVDGKNILTDPIWSDSTGPFGRIGPSRFRDPGISFEQLPPIDAVFVSHSHYDHMDLPTLKRLYERDNPVFVVALGNAGNLAKVGITGDKVIERNWWESIELSENLTMTVTPARHWSKRTLLDTNRTLWASFVLSQKVVGQSDKGLIFFAGDTGYDTHFDRILARLGPVKVSLMPIGAYLPRWFMKDNHISPSEALMAAADLDSSVMIPIHFGTFALGDDGQDQPLVDLLTAYRPDDQSTQESAGRHLELRVIDNGQSAVIALD